MGAHGEHPLVSEGRTETVNVLWTEEMISRLHSENMVCLFLCGISLTSTLLINEHVLDCLKVMLFASCFTPQGRWLCLWDEVPICSSGTQCPLYSAASLGWHVIGPHANQVGDNTTFPMHCMIIIRHKRQVYIRCKILIQFSMWCYIFLLLCEFHEQLW